MEPEHHETLSPSAFPALQHCALYLPSRRARSPPRPAGSIHRPERPLFQKLNMIAIIIFFSLCGLLLGYWMAIAGWEMVGEAFVCVIGMTILMFLICIGGVCAFGAIGLAMIGLCG